jgi:hypothetical protein
LKNSWGTSWGENGFGYVVTNWENLYRIFSISGIASTNYSNSDIICEDRDGDGYYFWGTGSKPATCPSCAPNEPDGDDSNPYLGPLDATGACIPITPISSQTLNISSNQAWAFDREICQNVVIHSGGTLLTAANITFQSQLTITIKNGGRLILYNGMIDNASIIAEENSSLTIENGTIYLRPNNELTVEKGAKFDIFKGGVEKVR